MNIKRKIICSLTLSSIILSLLNPTISAEPYKVCFPLKPKKKQQKTTLSQKLTSFFYNSTIGIIPNTFKDIKKSGEEIKQGIEENRRMRNAFPNPKEFNIYKDISLNNIEKILLSYNNLNSYGIAKRKINNIEIYVLSASDSREPRLANKTIIFAPNNKKEIYIYPIDPEERGMSNYEKPSTLATLVKTYNDLKEKTKNKRKKVYFTPYVISNPSNKNDIKEIGFVVAISSRFADKKPVIAYPIDTQYDALGRTLLRAAGSAAPFTKGSPVTPGTAPPGPHPW